MRPRLPLPLHDAVCRQAEAAGLTLNDYLGEVLAERTGVPYYPQDGEALQASA